MEWRDLMLLGTMVSQTTCLEFLVIVRPDTTDEERTISINLDCSYYEQLGGDRLIVNWDDATRENILAMSQSITHTFNPVKKVTEYKVRVLTPNGKCPRRLDMTKPICDKAYSILLLNQVINRGGDPEIDFSHFLEGTLFCGALVGLFDKNPQIESLSYAFANLQNIGEDYKSISGEAFAELTELKDISSIFEGSQFNNIEDGLFYNNPKIKNFNRAFANTHITSTNQIFNGNIGAGGLGNTVFTQSLYYNNSKLTNIDSSTFAGLLNVQDLSKTFQSSSNVTVIPDDLFKNMDFPEEVTHISFMFKDTKLNSISSGLMDELTGLKYITESFANTQITSIPEDLYWNCSLLVGAAGVLANTSISQVPEDLWINNYQITTIGSSPDHSNLYGQLEGTKITSIGPAYFISLNNLWNAGRLFKDGSISGTINLTFNPTINYAKDFATNNTGTGIILVPVNSITAETFDNLSESERQGLSVQKAHFWIANLVEVSGDKCIIKPGMYDSYDQPPRGLISVEITKSGFTLKGVDSSQELKIWDFAESKWKSYTDDLTNYYNMLMDRASKRAPVCIFISDDYLIRQICALYNGYYGTSVDPEELFTSTTWEQKIDTVVGLYNGYYGTNLNPADYYGVSGDEALSTFNSIYNGYYS